jgi:thiol-disulfide isomerase/thioredoxin
MKRKRLLQLILWCAILVATPLVVVSQHKFSPGKWTAQLHLSPSVSMPVFLSLESNELVIQNGDEHIPLIRQAHSSDSIDFHFPNFDSFIRVKATKKTMTGFWYNRLKGMHYKIPFSANLSKKNKSVMPSSNTISGKWEVVFSPGTESAYPAVGVFEQTGSRVTGTFLTETGDYRFLEGSWINNQLQLAAFDGSHAFLFTANYQENQLAGTFYSGNHWQTNWTAFPNEQASLRDADSITTIKDEKKIQFSFPDLQGNVYTYPNEGLEGKVIIMQLMGSWCPNCLDESLFYKSLQKKYGSQGLVVVSLCYEIPKSLEQKIHSVQRMKQRNELDFLFLIAGDAQKNLASTHFPMLNEIISFPTSLFINKKGDVVRIHTGFSGPGTGVVFEEYQRKTSELIESLLAQ